MIRMIAAIRAAITAAALLVGVPALLVVFGGSPLPDRAPSPAQVQAWLNDPLSPQYTPGSARVVAWLIWSLFAAMILTVWVLRARRWRWERLGAYLPGPVQGLSATLLGAATVTTVVGIPPAHAAAPATTGDTAADGPTSAVTAAGPTATVTGRHPTSASGPAPTVTVHRGDTLWDIAADRLGDPHHWKQIYRLNTSRHRDMRGGEHIEPGWTLVLPTGTAVPDHRPARPGTGPAAPTPAATSPTAHPGAGRTTAPTPRTTVTSPAAHPTVPTASSGRTAEPHGTAPGHPGDAGHRRQPTPGVSLPGGSWIDLGLATAITAAAALVWAHRRRRYSRHPLSENLRLNIADLAPMPPVVDHLHRRLRRHATDAAASGDMDTTELSLVATDPAAAHDRRAGSANVAATAATADTDESYDTERQQHHDEVTDQDFDDERIDATSVPARRPAPEPLRHRLTSIWGPAGLGLTGPGAPAAARGVLTATLAAGGIGEPHEHGCVIMPSATAATLLATSAVTLAHTPRLIVTGGLDDALTLLETQILYRRRILDAHEVDTVAELRQVDPAEEPLPPMMLLADTGTRHQRTRVAALLAQGQRLDVHGVLLGTWPDGTTIEVAVDGGTTPADGEDPRHEPHPADVGRLAVLTPTETRDLLTTLAESHTGQQQSPAPSEPNTGSIHDSGAVPAARAHDDEPVAPLSAPTSPTALRRIPPLIEDTDHGAVDASAFLGDNAPRSHLVATRPGNDPAKITGVDPVIGPADGDHTDERVGGGCDGDDERADAEAARTGRAEITVLGPVKILGLPAGITPRKKSLELLVYLAVHDGEATTEAILDDVLGDVAASKAPGRLYTYVSDLRTVLRRTTGSGTHLSHPDQRYVLNRDLIDIDLWRMQQAIRDAAVATLTTDPAERRTALRQAVDTYNGTLADGADYDWIEPYREAIRQQALDAHLALADMLTDTPAERITVLDHAIRHNPYAEQLYRQAMNTRAELGHLDAIRALRRALTMALNDIDAEPTDETTRLADQLIAQLQRTSRPQQQRAPRPGNGAAA